MTLTTINALLIEENLLEAQLFKAVVEAANNLSRHSSTLSSPKLQIHHVEQVTDAIAHLQKHPCDAILVSLESNYRHERNPIQSLKRCAPQIPVVLISSTPHTDIAHKNIAHKTSENSCVNNNPTESKDIQIDADSYLNKRDILSPERLSSLGQAHVGEMLIAHIQHTVQTVAIAHQLA
ncbi:MAG: hypothetical protein AAFZ17_06155, partial [Cyanobacteria bacterium J06650_10]